MNRNIGIVFAITLSLFLAGCGKKAPSSDTAAGVAPAEQAAAKPVTADDLLVQARDLRDGAPGVPVDKAKAFELFTQADSMGEPCASFFIAIMYELGEIAAPDNQKALEWYTKAQQNNCPADPKRISKFIAKHKK
jgi:hypothetical protein